MESMIAFRDFAPQQVSPAALLQPARYEPLAQVVAAANEWITAQGVEVVTVETVVLPNVWGPHAEGTEDPGIGTRGDFPIVWNQFIRVWYKKSPH
jgi:hypothetical protein